VPGTRGRARLAKILRASGPLISVEDAATALDVDRVVAAKLLARWQTQAWLQRVRRGVYAPVPLTATPADQVIDDPWILVPRLFDPAYVGGATAAHHWGLTEQLFRTIFVYTAQPVRRSQQTIRGISFTIRRMPAAKLFGTRAVWRGRVKIAVSDLHRTLLDLLDDPAMGGGIRQVADCLQAYLVHAETNPTTLLAYAERLGNGAVFKRLGFLAERGGAPNELVTACAARLTQGNAKLDPALPSPRLVRRWRLWIPERWAGKASPHD
jgi:predicted transcriptional regulator of viral defense system